MLARQSPTFSIGLRALRGGFWINSTPGSRGGPITSVYSPQRPAKGAVTPTKVSGRYGYESNNTLLVDDFLEIVAAAGISRYARDSNKSYSSIR
jgi:hypothetical protein